MATIVLYASKINNMPGMIEEMKKSVTNLKSEITNLRSKSLQVNKNICNLDDVISTISTSTQIQEDKVASLEAFAKESEQFITDTVCIDSKVMDLINQSKDDFYNQYDYLKPDSEKSGWEKFCDGVENVGEWCKEHWVQIVTVLVVIAVGIVAAVCGVAIAAIAAIAGLVSLVLCIADVICMIATGGKSIADVCREKGLGWLGEIFDGLSVGCDIVSIALPLGAALKAIAKVGVKTFAKASIHGMKVAFKKVCESLGKNGFKKGFKYGMKNLGKILFKTFIFDIDDITKVQDGKRVLDLMEEPINMINHNKNWEVRDGKLFPTDNIPKKNNPDGLTMKEIMTQYGYESIPLDKNGVFDVSEMVKQEVPMSKKNLDIYVGDYLSGNLSELDYSNTIRQTNFANADEMALKQQKLTKQMLADKLGYPITIHEDFYLKKAFYVPTQIHANVGHTGGVSNFKFTVKQIPKLSNIIVNKINQSYFRFELEN